MKKLLIISTIILAFSCNDKSDKIPELFAIGYDSHVELHWPNMDADKYRILLRQGDEFVLRAESTDTLYIDFVNDLGNSLKLEYKIEAVQADEFNATKIAKVQTSPFSDEELMDMVQYYTFRYFWQGAEPNSGMARERYHVDGDYPQNDKHVVTTGGTGFGIAAFPAAVERGWISREALAERMERMISFLETADRFHGVWPHWLDGETGKVKAFSEFDDGGDLVESAFLMQGLLIIREYFKDGNEREKALAARINSLWEAMEWDWYTRGGEEVLYWHWSPNHEWKMNFPLEGYNECLITYVLAAASPTHTVSADVYHKGWARNGEMKTKVNQYGHELSLRHNYSEQYGGPLFWSHYSFIGLNPKGLKDDYADYWEHNRNHTLINRQWCIENPENYAGYGEGLWGLTSSYSVTGYSGHKPTRDLGVITPTAALSSMPYTPEESMDVLINLYRNYGDKVFGKYGFYDALSVEDNWYPQRYLAIDQGPIVSMIENHRTGNPWSLFMSSPEIIDGLEKLGFEIKE